MFKKIVLTGLIIIFSSIGIHTYAIKMYINTGTLGGTQLKMLCPYNIPVSLYHNPSSGEMSDGATVVAAINTGQINVGYISDQNYNYFQTYIGNSPAPFSGFIFSGTLYNNISSVQNSFVASGGGSPTRFKATASNTAGFKFSGDKIIGTLGISTFSVNTTSTIINFWTQMGDNPSQVSLGNTNYLSSVIGAAFTFITGTCQTDIAQPYAQTFLPNINGTTKISSSSGLTFYLRDNTNEYTGSQPGFVMDTGVLNDSTYKTGAAGRNLGIQTGTLSFTLRGSGRAYNGGIPLVFTAGNITLLSGMTKTRDRFWRDYYVVITGSSLTSSYGIGNDKEKGMILSGTFSDRAGNTTGFMYSFNNPVKPQLTGHFPISGATNVFPKTDIRVKVYDDRAGVDSGSLYVTIKSGGCAGTVISGYTFTGTRLHLSGVAGTADFDDYRIKISSGDITNLPIPYVNICVTVSGMDLAGNSIAPYNTRTFVTRGFCSDLYGCMDPLSIYFPRQPSQISYTGSILYVTGASSPYPNLTYDNGNYLSGIINCGPTFSFTGFLLTGNIMTGGRYTGYNGNAILNFSGGTAQLNGTEITITPF